MLGDLPPELAEDKFWMKFPPPVLSIAVIGLAGGVAALIGVDAANGTAESAKLVSGVPWTVWRAVAGMSFVLFVLLTVQAIRILQHPYSWGFYPLAGRTLRYLLAAAAGCGGALIYQQAFPAAMPELPVRNQDLRMHLLFWAALVATAPWLTIVWLAHAECRDLATLRRRPSIAEAREYALAMDDRTRDPELVNQAIVQVQKLWQLLKMCSGAFALGVVAAVASAGALRGAFVDTYPDRAHEFPPANVLLYGVLFTLGLAVIAVPLAVAWRNRAAQLLDHACPLPADGQPTQEWEQEARRVATLLHLDLPYVRNPLYLLAVGTPLLVSALAAFLPILAN
ncbi:hypothetical protein AB0E69_22950 [Kribbella sp. NPDC026611]|uniref:hypothetical protein n=1 Tax=Kribbella sp. NPDC026611 TaxID=3154911 RepID=UPI003411660D